MSRSRSDQYEIRRLDQIRALASPARSRILLALANRGPASARTIAGWTGREPDSIHYHLRRLVAADLVRVREKRSMGPRSESIFEAAARVFHVDRSVRTGPFHEAMQKSVSAGLRLAEREFETAVADERFATGSRRRELHFQQQDVRLGDRDFREFRRRLDELGRFVAERHDPARGHWLTITTVITPGSGKVDD